jgi:hypothetical protein
VDAVPFDDAGWLPKPGVPNKDYVRTIFGFNTKQPYFSGANEPSNEDQSRLVHVCVCECVCVCVPCVYLAWYMCVCVCVCVFHVCTFAAWLLQCDHLGSIFVEVCACVRACVCLSLSLARALSLSLSLSLSACVLISVCVREQALIQAGVNVGAEGILT